MNWILLGRSILAVACVALISAAVLIGYFYYQSTEQGAQQTADINAARNSTTKIDPIDHGAIEFEKAHLLATEGNWEATRLLCQRIIEHYPDSARVPDARRILSEMNLDALLSRDSYPGKEIYTVRSGDSIGAVAVKFDTSYPYIVRVSGLTRAPNIQPNDQLVVCPLRFRLRVDLNRALIEIYEIGRNPDGSLAAASPAAIEPVPADGDGSVEDELSELLPSEPSSPPERFFAAVPILSVKLPQVLSGGGSHAVGDIVALRGKDRLPSYDPDFANSEKEISLGGGIVLRALPDEGEPSQTGLYLRRADLEDLSLILRRGQKVELVR